MLARKLALAVAAGAALVATSALADPRWEHERWEHRHHWHPNGYVVVRPAPVVVSPYYAPAPVYVAPPAPVYSVPAPAYYPAPVYAQPSVAIRLGFRL
jgi:hypothetical protein